MRRFVLYWALAGFLIPVAFLVAFSLLSLSDAAFAVGLLMLLDGLALLLWPSRMILMGMRGAPWSEIVPIMAISVAINVVLYSIVGAIAWWAWIRFKDQRK